MEDPHPFAAGTVSFFHSKGFMAPGRDRHMNFLAGCEPGGCVIDSRPRKFRLFVLRVDLLTKAGNPCKLKRPDAARKDSFRDSCDRHACCFWINRHENCSLGLNNPFRKALQPGCSGHPQNGSPSSESRRRPGTAREAVDKTETCHSGVCREHAKHSIRTIRNPFPYCGKT